jgi:hypothetical protein
MYWKINNIWSFFGFVHVTVGTTKFTPADSLDELVGVATYPANVVELLAVFVMPETGVANASDTKVDAVTTAQTSRAPEFPAGTNHRGLRRERVIPAPFPPSCATRLP